MSENQPALGSHWVLTNPRMDPETHAQLDPVDLDVEVVNVVSAHIRKGLSRDGKKKIEHKVPARVHFRYLETDLASELEVAGMDGTHPLGTFLEMARPK